LKKRTSIKVDLETMDQIEKLLESSGLVNRAKFAKEAIEEKIKKVKLEKRIELLEDEDNANTLNKMKELEERMETLEKQVGYFKEEYTVEEKLRLMTPEERREWVEDQGKLESTPMVELWEELEASMEKERGKSYSKLTPKQRKEHEADMKRVRENRLKKDREEHNKLFKE